MAEAYVYTTRTVVLFPCRQRMAACLLNCLLPCRSQSRENRGETKRTAVDVDELSNLDELSLSRTQNEGVALGVIDQLHKPKTQSSYRLVIHKSVPVDELRLIRDIARVKQILQNRGDRCRFVNRGLWLTRERWCWWMLTPRGASFSEQVRGSVRKSRA